jgi:hypothetical protein
MAAAMKQFADAAVRRREAWTKRKIDGEGASGEAVATGIPQGGHRRRASQT